MSKILQTTQPILSKIILNFPTPHYKTNNVILIHGYEYFNFYLFLVNNVAVLVINAEETVWKTSLAYFVAPWFNFLIFIALQIGKSDAIHHCQSFSLIGYLPVIVSEAPP